MGKDFWTFFTQTSGRQPELPPLAAAVAGGDEWAKRQARLRAESAAQSTRTDAALREFEEGLKETRQDEIDFYLKVPGLVEGSFAPDEVTDEMLEQWREAYRQEQYDQEAYLGPGKTLGKLAEEQGLNRPTAQVQKNLASGLPGGAAYERYRAGERNVPPPPRAQAKVGAAPAARAVGRAPRATQQRPQPVRDQPRLSPPPGGLDLAFPRRRKPFQLEPRELLDGYRLLYWSMAPKSLRLRGSGR